MLNYHDRASLNDRYPESIIYLKDDPIYITGTGDGSLGYIPLSPKLTYNSLIRGELQPKMVMSNDPDVRDNPFNLGFINGVQYSECIDDDAGLWDKYKTVSFVSRMPVRRWKQGLTQQNLHFGGKAFLDWRTSLSHEGFANTLRGKYPDPKQAWGMLDKKVRAVAYHRHWAFVVNKMDMVDLIYRGLKVGIGDDLSNIKLAKKYQWLQESYEIGVAHG